MGMIFVTKSDHQPLMELANTRVDLFCEITKIVAARYHSVNPLYLNGLAEVIVDEVVFCDLIDKFFEGGGKRMFYHWAEIATAIYEIIKDERVEWKWSENEIPQVPFTPFHTQAFVQRISKREADAANTYAQHLDA